MPSNFKQLQYIQSSGSQYINTEYKLNSNNVTYEWSAVDNETGTATSLFGAQDSGTMYSGILHGGKSSRPLWVGGTRSLNIGYVSNDSLYHDWRLIIQGSTATLVKDSVIVRTEGITGNLDKGHNIFVFANDYNGSVSQKTSIGMKYFRIIDDGVLKFNGVPAKRVSDGAIGMYDTVSGTFKTNAGSGAFTAGPEF